MLRAPHHPRPQPRPSCTHCPPKHLWLQIHEPDGEVARLVTRARRDAACLMGRVSSQPGGSLAPSWPSVSACLMGRRGRPEADNAPEVAPETGGQGRSRHTRSQHLEVATRTGGQGRRHAENAHEVATAQRADGVIARLVTSARRMPSARWAGYVPSPAAPLLLHGPPSPPARWAGYVPSPAAPLLFHGPPSPPA